MAYGRKQNKGNQERGRQQKRKTDQTYHPLFTIYLGYPDRQGKMGLSIKPYETKNGDGTEITKEQWLKIAADMYDGDFVLRGTLWENEGEYSSANGNLRLTGDELEQYPEERRSKSKSTKKAATSKPKYEEPEEDEEAEEDYEDADDDIDF